MKFAKTIAILSLALITTGDIAFAGNESAQSRTQASSANTQTAIRHLRLKPKARQVIMINQ